MMSTPPKEAIQLSQVSQNTAWLDRSLVFYFFNFFYYAESSFNNLLNCGGGAGRVHSTWRGVGGWVHETVARGYGYFLASAGHKSIRLGIAVRWLPSALIYGRKRRREDHGSARYSILWGCDTFLTTHGRQGQKQEGVLAAITICFSSLNKCAKI